MSMPPISPLNINGKATTYFQLLCDEAQKYLDDIELNFEGYETTVQKYKIVSDTDKEINYELSKEFNAWSEYFSEVANYIQNKYLDAETEKLQMQSIKSIEHNEKNVSAGDRKSNTDIEVINSRKKRNALKSLYDVLIAKQEFTEKAFYQCKNNCMKQDINQ